MIARVLPRTAVATATVIGVATMALLAGSRSIQGTRARQADDRPLTFFVADGDSRAGSRPSDRQLAEWAFETWARSSAGAITLSASPERDALVRLYWAPPDDNTFGEMRPFVVNGRPGAAVFVRADMEALGPEMAIRARQDTLWRDTIVYLTCLHEIGHALGLEHTSDFGDVMYLFGYGGDIVEYFARYRRQLKARTDIPLVSGLSDGDIRRLRALHTRQ